MSHFVDCVGWAASKMIFVFFYHFAADLRTFFLASQPNHQKNHVFLKVRLFVASTKTGRQKNTHFVAAVRTFFLIPDLDHQLPPESCLARGAPLAKAARHATEAGQARAARQATEAPQAKLRMYSAAAWRCNFDGKN